ncbi:MAG: branched-chain amino acid ABC transporter permease [Actinobacteria bacterium]|nr:MAG: branched-chain amino acid ABC transporter permease [Actinomycetota bacterium]
MVVATFLGINSFREVAQLFVNGILNGAGYGLLGAAFALILGTTGRFHFALALNYALAGFLTAVLESDAGLPLGPAIVVGLAAGVLLSVLCEGIVYRALASRAGVSTLLSVFVASLGLLIAGQNAMNLLWGSTTRSLTGLNETTVHISSVIFSSFALALLIAALVLCGGLEGILRRTGLGRQILAVRVNPLMASSVGVDVGRIFLIVFAIGGLLAGVAAIFQGLRFATTPDMGTKPIFYALVVAFFAGTHRGPLFQLATGIAIGMVEAESTIWLSAKLSSLVVFGLLLLYLSETEIRATLERARRRRRRPTATARAAAGTATLR